MERSPRNYEINITLHARERWIQRIIDPQRYAHLDTCTVPSCEHCTTLLFNIRNIVQNTRAMIDGSIANSFLTAKRANNKVTDVSFLKAMEDQHGDLSNFEFYLSMNGKAVFMVKNENGRSILVTVMSRDMIDGTALRNTFGNKELKELFGRWKFEKKQVS